MKLEELEQRLREFVVDEFGHRASVSQVRESDGHAGLTYLFDVIDARGQSLPFVIKVPPAGVKLKGNTDVMRQAPLLNALHTEGLAVPRVPYAYAESAWFDRPFIVMERLAGRVFFVWEPHHTFERVGERALNIWRQCVSELGAIHNFDWRKNLRDWEEAEALSNNLGRWRKIYQQALEPAWAQKAEQIEQKLADAIPREYSVGLFHGDFQPGNLLYEDHRFVATIDWELAGISAQELDLGWLLMVVDRQNWIDSYYPISPITEREVLSIYTESSGREVDDFPWFQAFAGFRLASIACLNHKLHVTGKRPEPAWEKLGQCIMPMFNRAEALLANYG